MAEAEKLEVFNEEGYRVGSGKIATNTYGVFVEMEMKDGETLFVKLFDPITTFQMGPIEVAAKVIPASPFVIKGKPIDERIDEV